MSQDMKQKVARKETPREAGQRAGRESQGCLTESATERHLTKKRESSLKQAYANII